MDNVIEDNKYIKQYIGIDPGVVNSAVTVYLKPHNEITMYFGAWKGITLVLQDRWKLYPEHTRIFIEGVVFFGSKHNGPHFASIKRILGYLEGKYRKENVYEFNPKTWKIDQLGINEKPTWGDMVKHCFFRKIHIEEEVLRKIQQINQNCIDSFFICMQGIDNYFGRFKE